MGNAALKIYCSPNTGAKAAIHATIKPYHY